MEYSWSLMATIVLVHYLLALEGTSIGRNETDHLALLEFKAQISSDPLEALKSWNSSAHFCSWLGVTCSRRHHQRVTVLDLSHSKLSGSISPHIGNLSFLKEVYLHNNSFTHLIPIEFGNLRRLQQLWLFNNSLQGTITTNISACSRLATFRAEHNKLEGEIPVELGSLSNLLFLSLESNNLTGNIPPSFGNLSSLEYLFMDYNNLSGSIPNELGQLKNLNIIAMGSNMLSGTFPPSIFNLTSLMTIDLGANQIHGTLPSNLFNNLPHVTFFSIGRNQFTGTMPISLSNASNLELFQVTENKLHGKVSSLEKLHKLEDLRCTNNNLGTGGVEDDLLFLCSLANATKLLDLSLSVNNFGRELPGCIGNLSTTLVALLMDNNIIHGGIPIGIGNLVNLERLDLFNNQLSGNVPVEIGNLRNMKEMALSGNKLSGQIPSTIGNLKLLLKLFMYNNNFEGSIPSNISQCQNLILLNLFNNNLSGGIPPDVIGISSLSMGLSFGKNQLTGPLPVEVGNLKNIGILDFSQNLLSGEIPNALGSCVKLEALILGGNFFQGNIPSSFSSLRGIVELNLSHNHLYARIPDFLESFKFLKLLDLSYNNFKGMVPKEGVFKNANATFLIGNSKLCGGIPEFKLPKCKYKKSRFTVPLVLVLALVSLLVFILFMFSVVLLCYFKKERAMPTTASSWKLLPKVSYQELLRATDQFSSANMIGIGSFGYVYKGVLQRVETVVAVKVFNLLHHGAFNSFIAECEALRNIRHRNIVKIITACSGIDHSGNDFKALVYEFMINGSLDEWLHPVLGTENTNELPKKLSFLHRLNIMIDVASALDYLHHNHQQSPIVHCDLKPGNVLLDAEMAGHVGDFGLARFLHDVKNMETSSNVIKGSIGYTPPEYGIGNKLSTKGDVYSYGILLLEVFTGKRPTDDMFQGNLDLHSFVVEALPNKAMEVSDPILLQDTDKEMTAKVVECLVSIFGIGVACCAQVSRERLCINDALAQLSCARDKFLAA